MSFIPTEIIFSATDACNLHCEHCFVSRTPNRLTTAQAITFLTSYLQAKSKNNSLPTIEKIGFSGGEPFLYIDFITTITKFAVSNDFLFDQIMTNGDWWKTEEDLRTTLKKIYDTGYDGKIGLSWDTFHGQKTERMETFIKTVHEIFGPNSLNIQTVINKEKKEGKVSPSLQPASQSSATLSNGDNPRNAPVFLLPQTFPSTDERAWKNKKWFKEDYCKDPGNILYIHSNGNIAPCCGFANENHQLFIGTINDTYEQVIQNAANNKMIEICFTKGLSKYKKEFKKVLRKQGKKYPGKCNDICSFCDFVCKNIK